MSAVGHPTRWQCDALAVELQERQERERVLAAAEAEVAEARRALDAAPRPIGPLDGRLADALDRYLHAVIERNAIRDGRP